MMESLKSHESKPRASILAVIPMSSLPLGIDHQTTHRGRVGKVRNAATSQAFVPNMHNGLLEVL